MENEDKIVAGIQQLHEDLEKLREVVEKNYESALGNTQRMWRRNLGVYLTVVAGAILWWILTYYYSARA